MNLLENKVNILIKIMTLFIAVGMHDNNEHPLMTSFRLLHLLWKCMHA